jgi:hypothetical protein
MFRSISTSLVVESDLQEEWAYHYPHILISKRDELVHFNIYASKKTTTILNILRLS